MLLHEERTAAAPRCLHMQEEAAVNGNGWSLDKKVPIALIATLFLCFLGETAIWVSFRAETNLRLERLEHDAEVRAPLAQAQGDRIIRLEAKVDSVYDRLSEIKGLLAPLPTPPRR